MGRRRRPKFDASGYDDIVSGVKAIYRDMVRPLEEQYLVNQFHYPMLTDQDFDAKPMVLLIGSYSVGKTTFIKYLLDRDYPGAHIGPEPTTDRFQAIMFGHSEREIPGHALISNPLSPFAELTKFGNTFLSRLYGCEVPSDFAMGCTLVDTPGVLAGRKQTEDRQYSYYDVIKWFAPRCDMILLMFDANKVDIPDELADVIRHLEGYDDKIRVILNKADSLEPHELLKINSALTWNLARILKGAETRRIYVGSFWDQPLRPSYMMELFETETTALLNDLALLPRNNTTNKLNDLVYRTRMVRCQALVLDELRSETRKVMMGKDKKQKELIAGLEDIFFKVSRAHAIPPGDFPDVAKFRHILATNEYCRDFTKFKKLDDKLLGQLDTIIRDHIGNLMSAFEAVPAATPAVPSGGMRQPEPKGQPAQSTWQPKPQEHAAPEHSVMPPPSAPPSDPWSSSPVAVPSAPTMAPRDPWATAPAAPPARPADTAGMVDGLFGRPTTAAAPPAPVPPPPTVALSRMAVSTPWAVTSAEKTKYDSIFEQMVPEDGKVGGSKVAPVLKRSGLDQAVLRDIWNLVDVNEDGLLDGDWFAVAMHLTMKTKRGEPLPTTIPEALIPPSSRR